MTMHKLLRDLIGWAAAYGEGRAVIPAADWDRITDAKAREFAGLAEAEQDKAAARWNTLLALIKAECGVDGDEAVASLTKQVDDALAAAQQEQPK